MLPFLLGAAQPAASSMLQCCVDDVCSAVPLERGCNATEPPPLGKLLPPTARPAPPPSPGAQMSAAAAAREALELGVEPAWFLTNDPPYRTPRGWLAEALKKRSVIGVFAGTIEGEHAFEGSSPRWRWGILTWCSIRVERVWKGAHLKPGDVVDVLYHGGSLGPGYSSWPSHEPRCLPFDYGIFSVGVVDGVTMPIPLATMSMIESGLEIDAHPLTRALDELQPVLAPQLAPLPARSMTPKTPPSATPKPRPAKGGAR